MRKVRHKITTMKLSLIITLALANVAAVATASSSDSERVSAGAFLKKEDESYWKRLMQETMSVAPTPPPPPTLQPPTPPTPVPPTPAPTAAPKRCECDVKITCETEDEIECNAFSIPTLECASPLSEVRFQYTGGDCSDSNNDQRDDVCEDTNGGPPADTEVLVQCLDSEINTVLASELLSPGGTIDVLAGESGGLLPEELECRVSSTDESILYQTLFFSTTQSFTAKSVYGSLEVERCDELECIMDVMYFYTATNAGEAPINITRMTRVRNGDTLDLTDQVDPKELDVGEQTVVTEPDQVDYCVTSSITTKVMISSNGEQCLVNPVRRRLLRFADTSFENVIVKTAKYDLALSV